MTQKHPTYAPPDRPAITDHAEVRMAQRGIRPHQLALALEHGRALFVRGALVYVIGRREVRDGRAIGVDLDPLDGLHVVCSTDGVVITAYRNKQLNPRDHRSRHFARAA